MSPQGRSLPTADVGSPVAHLGGHLSGGEIARPTSAGRPTRDTWPIGFGTPNQPLVRGEGYMRADVVGQGIRTERSEAANER